jgi:AraC-like DNA-binding protein
MGALSRRAHVPIEKACPAELDYYRHVHLWRVAYNSKLPGLTFTAAPGFGHSLLAPLATSIFQTLRISASVFEHGEEWILLHGERSVLAFEYEHGRDVVRAQYNHRCLAKVERLKRPIRGEHAGYVDLFVPIVARKKLVAVLVSGPFALERPTAAGILERWRALTGRQGHPADPDFAAYLSAALSVLVLDGDKSVAFERMLVCLAQLMAGEGAADSLMNQIEHLRAQLMPARLAEKAWDLLSEIVDQRSVRSPHTGPRGNDLRDLGLARVTDHVVVGLTVSRAPGQDPVDEVVRRDGFQRAAFEVGRQTGDVVTGRVGDHGIVQLIGSAGSPQKKRQKVRDLSERLSAIARQRHGLSAHFGACAWSESFPLSRSYQAALAAAESSLMIGRHLELGEPVVGRRPHSLRHLRDELRKAVEEQPQLLGARFDRYLEAIAGEHGYRFEPARAQLELGFERLAQTLLGSGALDDRSFAVLCDDLDRSTESARTLNELFAAYRRIVADMAHAAERPAGARRDRHLRSAVEYIHQHYGEKLGRKTVARVAGFAPGYFSQLFKKSERKTFEQYVQGLRLDRAKQLLETTALDAARVAELSGFSNPQYFSRAFRRSLGITPLDYRERAHRMSRVRVPKSRSKG